MLKLVVFGAPCARPLSVLQAFCPRRPALCVSSRIAHLLTFVRVAETIQQQGLQTMFQTIQMAVQMLGLAATQRAPARAGAITTIKVPPLTRAIALALPQRMATALVLPQRMATVLVLPRRTAFLEAMTATRGCSPAVIATRGCSPAHAGPMTRPTTPLRSLIRSRWSPTQRRSALHMSRTRRHRLRGAQLSELMRAPGEYGSLLWHRCWLQALFCLTPPDAAELGQSLLRAL